MKLTRKTFLGCAIVGAIVMFIIFGVVQRTMAPRQDTASQAQASDAGPMKQAADGGQQEANKTIADGGGS